MEIAGIDAVESREQRHHDSVNVLSKQNTRLIQHLRDPTRVKQKTVCSFCHVKEHLERICRKKPKGAIKLHFVENCSDSDEHSQQVLYHFGVFSVSNN